MSVFRPVIIWCDVCEDGSHEDNSHTTVRNARAEARLHGWRRTRDGRDVCPWCVKEGRR